MRTSVLAMILAGGEGRRLAPLTDQRAKPSVPFGGKYRIIDFVLSNFINSGIDSIFVLTQFKSQSLMEHIINGWNIASTHVQGRFIIPVPGADADRGQVVVYGNCGRDFPERAPDRGLQPGSRRSLRRRSHLQNGHQPDGRFPCQPQRNCDRRRDSGSD